MSEWNLSVVYISAPPDVSHFIQKLIGHIRNRGYRGYFGDDLAKFAKDCFSGDPQVFSSLEQEVCSQSMGFLYSPGSSWSLNTAIGKFISNQPKILRQCIVKYVERHPICLPHPICWQLFDPLKVQHTVQRHICWGTPDKLPSFWPFSSATYLTLYCIVTGKPAVL